MRPPILLALVACVASSAVGAESPRPFAPSVSLSKAIVISERPVRESQALLGADGDAHLVVLGAKSGALEHYRLHGSEIIAHEIIDADPDAGALTAAFDGAGVLNVAYGGRLYAPSPSGWARRMSAPECDQLTRAGSTLVCVFVAKNAEPGHRGKWNFGIIGIGGGMGGIVLPYAWFQRNHLLVVAREASADHWNASVLGGPGEFSDTGASYALAGGSDGVVHVLYDVDNLTRFMAAGSKTEVLYARLPPTQPSSAEEAAQSTTTVVGSPLRPYVPTMYGNRSSCIEPMTDGTRMLLLVASDSPYVAGPSSEPVRVRAARGLKCKSELMTDLVAFHADDADGVHLVASVDHRDSLWFGPKYYDLCYQHHGASGSTDATAIGRRAPAGASPVSIVSDGHGVALVTWIDAHHAFLARWVRLNPATPTAAPSALDAEDPEVRAHCQARWPSTLSELQLSEESGRDPAMAEIAAGEHVRDRIDGVRWDRAATHRFTSFAHLLEQPLGTVVITDKALYFTSDAPPKPRGAQANVGRMELSSLRGTELQKFGRFHWLAIHRVDDNDEYVAGNDDEATQEVATRLASLIAQPDAVGADP